jgi:hypothetical protein
MASVSATPARVSITCVGGDDLNVQLTATYSDGTFVDFTGANTGQVRDHPTSDVVRATLTITDSGTVNGVCNVLLDAVDTRALLALGPDPLVPTAYFGYWDMQAVHPTTLQTRTVAGGSFVVNVDVTR